MASYAKPIADAVVAVIRALPGGPGLVVFRKADVTYTTDALDNGVIVVTVGMETPTSKTFDNSILKTYTVGITYYITNAGNLTSTMDALPEFVLKAKRALDGTSLAGMSVVWSVDIIEAAEWEDQKFGTATEASTFGLTVHTAEPRTG